MDFLARQLPRLFLRSSQFQYYSPISALMLNKSSLHTSMNAMAYEKPTGPKRWPSYNNRIFPPQASGEERRPAYVCHMRVNIKYSPWKMWYVASMIRGMSIGEALKQLSFVDKKGAVHVKEVLLEAQKLAVEEHNVEFPTNLWVAESFTTKGAVFKGIRRHAKMRMGIVRYFHCHYFVRLEEGPPPKEYYLEKQTKTTEAHLSEWLHEMRQRRIPISL